MRQMSGADLRYSIGTINFFGHLQFTRTMGASPGVPERIVQT